MEESKLDIVLQNVLAKLGESKTELSESNMHKMKRYMPIPKEYEILWADVVFPTRTSGLVITDKALIIRGDIETLKKRNSQIDDKKKRITAIYHLIKWGYFDPDAFKIDNTGDTTCIYYYDESVLVTSLKASSMIFSYYKDETKLIINASSLSAGNIMAAEGAVIPENYSSTRNRTGHGQMAEEVLTIIDKIKGRTARVIGRTNAKNGADRLVNGVELQTKFYATGSGCVESCFDKQTGLFRYINNKGKPMVIEVPKDKYFDALISLKKKIADGKVPGITNPNRAKDIVKQGELTYNQALNFCKAGTIESLTYDMYTGAINCIFPLGISFLTTYYFALKETGNHHYSMQAALKSGLQVFGMAYISHILVSQVARTDITKQLIPMSEYLVEKLGTKATKNIVNSIRSISRKVPISGAAASKQLAKILRSNLIASVLSFVVFSVPDTFSVFKKYISKSQWVKNMLSLVGSIVAGGGGMVAGTIIGTKIGALIGAKAGGTAGAAVGTFVKPGSGTVAGVAVGSVAGTIGGAVGGAVAGTGTGILIKTIGNKLVEDDSLIMQRMYISIVINMVYDYMLDETEQKLLSSQLDTIDKNEFKKYSKQLFASNEQEKMIINFTKQYFDNVVSKREKIPEPSSDDIVELLAEMQQPNIFARIKMFIKTLFLYIFKTKNTAKII